MYLCESPRLQHVNDSLMRLSIHRPTLAGIVSNMYLLICSACYHCACWGRDPDQVCDGKTRRLERVLGKTNEKALERGRRNGAK